MFILKKWGHRPMKNPGLASTQGHGVRIVWPTPTRSLNAKQTDSGVTDEPSKQTDRI